MPHNFQTEYVDSCHSAVSAMRLLSNPDPRYEESPSEFRDISAIYAVSCQIHLELLWPRTQ